MLLIILILSLQLMRQLILVTPQRLSALTLEALATEFSRFTNATSHQLLFMLTFQLSLTLRAP